MDKLIIGIIIGILVSHIHNKIKNMLNRKHSKNKAKFSASESNIVEHLETFKKEYPIFTSILLMVFSMLMIVPVIIWLLYYIGDSGLILIYNSPSIGDTLSFYGSLLAFIGTICLGGLAFWQNIKANDINEKLLKLEIDRESLLNTPFISHIGTKPKVFYKYSHITSDSLRDITIFSFAKPFLQPGDDNFKSVNFEMSFKNTTSHSVNVEINSAEYNSKIYQPNDTKILSLNPQENGVINLFFELNDLRSIPKLDMSLFIDLTNYRNEVYPRKYRILSTNISVKPDDYGEYLINGNIRAIDITTTSN